MMVVIVKSRSHFLGVFFSVSSSRDRMVASAATLIGERGITATSLADVIADSGSPRGSIYHYFPGGKAQLAAEALSVAARQALGYLQMCPAETPRGVMEWFVAPWRARVVETNGTHGCVLAGTSLGLALADQRDEEAVALAVAVREEFIAWHIELTSQFERVGMPPARANTLARLAVSAMEGALILCRVEASVTPLDETADELMRLTDQI